MAEGDPWLGKADTWKGHIITLSTEEDMVPTLYHAEPSYFSQVACLVLEEEDTESSTYRTSIPTFHR